MFVRMVCVSERGRGSVVVLHDSHIIVLLCTFCGLSCSCYSHVIIGSMSIAIISFHRPPDREHSPARKPWKC